MWRCGDGGVENWRDERKKGKLTGGRLSVITVVFRVETILWVASFWGIQKALSEYHRSAETPHQRVVRLA